MISELGLLHSIVAHLASNEKLTYGEYEKLFRHDYEKLRAANSGAQPEQPNNSAMPKCLCKGWFSVRNIIIQQCGTCGGVINQRTSA